MKTPLCFLFALVVSMSSALAAIPEEIEGPDLLTKNSLALAMSGTEKTVVFFVSPNCPCSKAHEPTMKTLFEKFGTQFRFVAVHANQNETADSARDHYAAAKFPFPVLRDEDSQLANGLGALKTPHVFVLEGNRILFQGGIDDSTHPDQAKKHYLSDALTAIADGKKPPVEKARALGCVIER